MVTSLVKYEDYTSNKIDKKISLALMASYVILTIQYLILIYFNLLGTSLGSAIQLSSKVIVAITFIYALPSVLKRSLVKFIEVYFIATFIYLIHYTIFPENRVFLINLLFSFFFISLPAFIYSFSIKDLKVLKEIMKKTSRIIFVVGFMIGVLAFSGVATVGSYSMTLSYYLLLPSIIYLDELMDDFSLKKLLIVFTAILIIISLGSRGPVFCIGVFIFLKFIKIFKKLSYKNLLKYISIFSSGIIGFVFIDNILILLSKFLLTFGIRSRSISLFLGDKIYLSGRENLYELVIKEIMNKPVMGIGIAGDRRVLGGGYVHNFLIEIIANFGIIVGSFLVIILVLMILKVIIKKNQTKYNIAIIWISLGFISLIFSGSYITDMQFWIFLGILINVLFFNKTEEKYNE